MPSLIQYARSKTIAFAAFLAVLGVVETQFNLLAQYIAQDLQGLVYVGISAVVAALRVVTKEPLDEK